MREFRVREAHPEEDASGYRRCSECGRDRHWREYAIAEATDRDCCDVCLTGEHRRG